MDIAITTSGLPEKILVNFPHDHDLTGDIVHYEPADPESGIFRSMTIKACLVCGEELEVEDDDEAI